MSVEDFYRGKNIAVTGGCGFVGGTLVKKLVDAGANQVVVLDTMVRGNRKIKGALYHPSDVTRLESCAFWFKRVDVVFNLAASVAGVLHNMSHHTEMYTENIGLVTTPVMAAQQEGVKHFLQVSSVCIYDPRLNHPSFEESGMLGEPHFANAGYAEAKRDGERMIQWSNLDHAVIVRPSNIYGPFDYFDEKAHVIPALIRKSIDDDVIHLYGPSQTEREFIFVHDVADGMMHAMAYGRNKTAYNIGCHGKNKVSMILLAEMIREGVGYPEKEIIVHSDEGGGDPIRFSSCSRMNDLGWRWSTPLDDGLLRTIEWYKSERV